MLLQLRERSAVAATRTSRRSERGRRWTAWRPRLRALPRGTPSSASARWLGGPCDASACARDGGPRALASLSAPRGGLERRLRAQGRGPARRGRRTGEVLSISFVVVCLTLAIRNA
ncbi:MAG: hypothetical protein MZW92_53030, partial [Comamonadaceae bacterium]|nr:hypothetical protein [Comamonadaceae bacterium]